MIVIGENLSGIVKALSICAEDLVEEFSLGVRLDRQVYRMRPDVPRETILTYGVPYNSEDFFYLENTPGGYLPLAPGESLLACSADNYQMPKAYFGLVQTKGSLARLLVSATCNDGQVEPGYRGRITLEVTNNAAFGIHIPFGETIAQVFVFRCSTETQKPYAGRYQGAAGPTLATFI